MGNPWHPRCFAMKQLSDPEAANRRRSALGDGESQSSRLLWLISCVTLSALGGCRTPRELTVVHAVAEGTSDQAPVELSASAEAGSETGVDPRDSRWVRVAWAGGGSAFLDRPRDDVSYPLEHHPFPDAAMSGRVAQLWNAARTAGAR